MHEEVSNKTWYQNAAKAYSIATEYINNILYTLCFNKFSCTSLHLASCILLQISYILRLTKEHESQVFVISHLLHVVTDKR